MPKYLNGATAALLLAGTALVTTGAARADDNRYSNDRPSTTISLSFGDVATGYRDGYYDNSHSWHRWNGDTDYQAYRLQHADSYRDYNHDRDSNNGAIAVSFGDVSMGYRDGYLDNGRHFHNWGNDGDYRTYRSQHADSYRDYNHDRDGNGAIAVSFGNVSMGYRDGYMDNDRHFHNWDHDGDYQTYRNEHGGSYHDWNHDRGNVGVSIGFGDIAFGYRDGYWDNRHHWHHWHHRNDYRSYRDQNGSNYHDDNHYREDNNGWRQQ
jgi:hypothetical protein